MAAPTKSFAGELKVEKTAHIPDELNLTSPKLDPLKVLYSENVYLPHKYPTTFNNLAEFENVVIRGNVRPVRLSSSHRGRGKRKQEGTKRTRIFTLKTQAKTEESDTSENDEALARLRNRRKKMNRNVLTRMTDYEKGPMTLLKRAVEEQLRVKVWTRSAVSRRGYCIAYIIAFDKHFNLALMDVDETYRIPKVVRKPVPESTNIEVEKGETVNVSSNEELVENLIKSEEVTSQLRTYPHSPVHPQTYEKSDSEDTDSGVSKLTQKLTLHQPNKLGVDAMSGHSQHAVSTDESLTMSNPVSDITSSNCHLSERKTIDGGKVEIPVISDFSNSSEVKKEEKQTKYITEIHYKTKQRHVNQLFVRGDNVVSVVLLE